MIVNAKIMSMDVTPGANDPIDLMLVGHQDEIRLVLRVEAPRALVAEFALGDLFQITLERVSLDRVTSDESDR